MKVVIAGLAAAAALFLVSWVASPTLDDFARSRSVEVTTTACGVASRTNGTAVLFGESHVLTAAHLVIGAGSVSVRIDGTELDADVIGLDRRTDLALLDVAGVRSRPLELGNPRAGDAVIFAPHGGESQWAEITRTLEIRIEEERSTTRSSRFGFELDTSVSLGDSGSGVYNDNGELLGLIFGRSTTRENRSFAVRSSEIEELLAAPARQFVCNPAESQILPI